MMYQLVGSYRNVSGRHVPVWHDPYSEYELIGCMVNAGGYRVPALPNGFGEMNWPILGCTEKINGKKVPVIDYDACCMCENDKMPTPQFLKVTISGISMRSDCLGRHKSFEDVRIPLGEFYVKFCYSDLYFGSCTWKGVYTGNFGYYKCYETESDCTGDYTAYKVDRFLINVNFYDICSEENPTVQNRIEIGCSLYSTELAAACENSLYGSIVMFGGLKYSVEPEEGKCIWEGQLTGSELKMTSLGLKYPTPPPCCLYFDPYWPYTGVYTALWESGAYLGVGLGQIESCTNWLPDVHYERGDCVVQDGIIYWCIRDHLSTLYGEDKPLSGSNWQYYWCVNDGYC